MAKSNKITNTLQQRLARLYIENSILTIQVDSTLELGTDSTLDINTDSTLAL